MMLSSRSAERGSMKAVVLMATPCPKSLHGKGGEVDRAQHLAGPGLATADDCDDGEEVSRVRFEEGCERDAGLY